jgi:hypothetical protein
VFHRSQVELFARFGECARWDGLVTRITAYADDARSQVAEVRECYERRKDKLRERVTLLASDTVVVRGLGRGAGGWGGGARLERGEGMW